MDSGGNNAAVGGSEASTRIRQRLLCAKRRFNANANIAEFIEPGELDLLLEEETAEMKTVLEGLVIENDNGRRPE